MADNSQQKLPQIPQPPSLPRANETEPYKFSESRRNELTQPVNNREVQPERIPNSPMPLPQPNDTEPYKKVYK